MVCRGSNTEHKRHERQKTHKKDAFRKSQEVNEEMYEETDPKSAFGRRESKKDGRKTETGDGRDEKTRRVVEN